MKQPWVGLVPYRWIWESSSSSNYGIKQLCHGITITYIIYIYIYIWSYLCLLIWAPTQEIVALLTENNDERSLIIIQFNSWMWVCRLHNFYKCEVTWVLLLLWMRRFILKLMSWGTHCYLRQYKIKQSKVWLVATD